VSVAALTSNELQFLYCTADAIQPSLAAGAEAKMIASPLVGLPWVIIARKEIRRVEDLKGKTFIATRPGGIPDTLIRALMKKMNFTTDDLAIRHIGGAGPKVVHLRGERNEERQTEVYNALQQGLGQATMVTAPVGLAC
jgi:ABC-type nitrate/sulfonate/bicarbonate transport system substrate-binding protein